MEMIMIKNDICSRFLPCCTKHDFLLGYKTVPLATRIALGALSGGLAGSLITLAAGFTLTPYIALGAVVGVVVGIAIAVLTKPKNTRPTIPPIIPVYLSEPANHYEALLNYLLNDPVQLQSLAKMILEANDKPTDLSQYQLEEWTTYVVANREFPDRIGDDAVDGHIVFEVLLRLMKNIDLLKERFDGELGGPNHFMDGQPFWCFKEEHKKLVKNFLGICNLRLKNCEYYERNEHVMAEEIAPKLFPGLYNRNTYNRRPSQDETYNEETDKAVRLTKVLLSKSPTTVVEGSRQII
jgi:hypothetical protein